MKRLSEKVEQLHAHESRKTFSEALKRLIPHGVTGPPLSAKKIGKVRLILPISAPVVEGDERKRDECWVSQSPMSVIMKLIKVFVS